MTLTLIRGDARALPLRDASADLIVTSPPYWSLRSYTDAGRHYDGQIGAEPTPGAYIDNLIACTAEWARVLKPTGSIWVNLGDKYSGYGVPNKSLIGLPWRYALRCIDDLGLILRAEIIWSKPNGLPESVTDRVRRSHETWFHLTRSARYYAAVDTIREARAGGHTGLAATFKRPMSSHDLPAANLPLGKLPGSVWTVATQPLKVPAELGIDHFASFPMAWPRRIISGWSPSGICTVCDEGRRPVATRELTVNRGGRQSQRLMGTPISGGEGRQTLGFERTVTITGEACACPDTSAPIRAAVVLDPFGGTGTTALVSDVLGRHGISVDMSADYLRLARWRCTDPGQRARAAATATTVRRPRTGAGQLPLFG